MPVTGLFVEDPLNRDRFLAGQIAEGIITLDSVSDFQSILQKFPENPALYAAYADLLVRRKRFDTAADAYGRAAELFLRERRLLAATVYRVLEWRLNKPAREAALRFHEQLCEMDRSGPPIHGFLTRLSFPEWIAFTNRIARRRLDAHQKIKKIGDIESALYLIVSGVVRDTRILPLQGQEPVPPKEYRYLSENEFFGTVFPFEEEHISGSYAETLTIVEMAVISRRRLREACRKYPGLERALVALLESSADEKRKAVRSQGRKADRRLLPVRIRLQLGGSDPGDGSYEGFTRDISVGGVCALLEAEGRDPSVFSGEPTVRVRFLGAPVSLEVEGRIAWSRPVETAVGKKTPAVGIQFRNLTPKMAGLLMVFADMLYEPAGEGTGDRKALRRDNRNQK
jgi:CRP-like cAMP-binding protein